MNLFITAIILSVVLLGCSDEKKSAASDVQKMPTPATLESSPKNISKYDSRTLVKIARELFLPTLLPELERGNDAPYSKGKYGECLDFVNLPIDKRLEPQVSKDPFFKDIREACGSRFFNPDITFDRASDRFFKIHNLNIGVFGLAGVKLLTREGRITAIEKMDYMARTSSYHKVVKAILANGLVVSKDDQVINGDIEKSRLEISGGDYTFHMEISSPGRSRELSAKLSYNLPEDDGAVLEIEDFYTTDAYKKTCRIVVKKAEEILFSESSDDKNCNFMSDSLNSVKYL